MGYQHEHQKTPVQDVHVYPRHRPTGCMVTITVRAIFVSPERDYVITDSVRSM